MAFNIFRWASTLVLLASFGCAGHADSPPSAMLPQMSATALRRGASPAGVPNVPTTVYISDFSKNWIDFYSDGGRELSGRIVDDLDNVGALAVDPSTSTLYASSLVTTEVYPGSNGRVRLYDGRVALPIAGYDWSWYQIPKTNPLDYTLISTEAVIGSSLFVGATLAPRVSGGTAGEAIAQLPLFSTPADALAPSQRAFDAPESWCPSQMAGDARGDLYVAFVYLCGNSDPMLFQLREYAPDASVGSVLPLPAAVRHTLGGMTLDGKGDLVTCDAAHLTISIYPPGKTTAARTISKGLKGCRGLVFGAGYKALYVIDQPIVQLTAGYPGVVDVFDYASGRKVYAIAKGLSPTTSLLSGVAIDPPAQPGLPYH